MPLDPQVAAFYARKKQNQDKKKSTGPVSVDEMRKNADATFNDKITRTDIFRTEERRISGTSAEIPLRLYWPEDTPKLPVLLFFHGGGFVIHNLASHDSLCRMLSKEGHCLVISVGYRLAPEHPYPAAMEDAFDALRWASAHAEALGGDPQQIYVGGDSAGATISAALSLMDRDQGDAVIKGQLLFYGSYNCLSLEESESVRLFGNGEYVLPRPSIELFEKLYAPETVSPEDIYRYPGKAADLSRLPRTLSVTAEYDPLRDDGEAFARKLTDAGNEVTQLRVPGVMHGFLLYWYEFDRAREVLAEAGSFLHYSSTQSSTGQ